MSAIWRDSGLPSFFGAKPIFSFHELAEIHAIAPASYEQARFEMNAREHRLGAEYYRHNAELAHSFWERKKPWWLF